MLAEGPSISIDKCPITGSYSYQMEYVQKYAFTQKMEGSKLTPYRAGRSQQILELLKLSLCPSLFASLACTVHGPLVSEGAIPLA